MIPKVNMPCMLLSFVTKAGLVFKAGWRTKADRRAKIKERSHQNQR
jgi:hypothetical protein